MPQARVVADFQKTMIQALPPVMDQYRATFAAVQPSLNLISARLTEMNSAMTPAAESIARSQRQIVQAMARSLPAIKAMNAQFQHMFDGVDLSAFFASVQTVIDLDDDELEQLIADLDEDEQSLDLLDGDELADWEQIRRVMAIYIAVLFGLKVVEFHLKEPEIAAFLDVIVAAYIGASKVYKHMARADDD